MRTVTSRGSRWEWRQSWWFGLVVIYRYYWLALVYMGIRVREPNWIVWGGIYGATSLLMLFFGATMDDSARSYLAKGAFWAFVIALGHSLYIRDEFLYRLSAMEEAKEEALLEDLAREEAPQMPSGPASSPAVPKVMDVNEASESHLAMLPGFGPDLARHVVEIRRTRGGFHSFDEFADVASLGSDLRESLRPRIATVRRVSVQPTAEEQGLLDLNYATERQLAGLPGMTAELAAKAIRLRQRDGMFHNFADFVLRVNPDPHAAVRLRPLVIASAPLDYERKRKGKGRLVDF